MPPERAAAIAGDRRSVSPCGDTAPTEDFAEAWYRYRDDLEALRRLERRYPRLARRYEALPELRPGTMAP